MDQNVLIILCVYLTQADHSRAFFNVSSGAENVLKSYFVFGALTKSFQKGPKLIISLWRSLDFIKIYTSVSQNLYHHFAHFCTSIRLDDGVA